MHTQRRIPPGRTAGAGRRPRPAPLSPHPEWRAQHLFVEPRYSGSPASDDVDDDVAVPAPAEPPGFQPRRRPYLP
ncbi:MULTISPECIES: hypothetical protein [Streptomyces]|uniref:Uncharacterized protein n=1 Tax=Streptomyces griseiscabiei TaxID=2993540 RepID=A0ABU4LEV7_9ACTN|nr:MULTISPECIES: hypothetical protein [Streptomyces]MBZ3908317.1 hypothetical protein [Streptomyces griseiscabiei]MDX2913830.1 hypothetical protein [Streptomyces griseiscabiei]